MRKYLALLFLLASCGEKQTSVSVWVSGNKIETLRLPGRAIFLNPDSADRVLIVGDSGKIVGTILPATDPSGRLLNKVAADSTTMNIYVYVPVQHSISVYDADGAYRHGKTYLFDSTGRSTNGF